jgi:glycosyltransferase involved in cell wall biosynthesis
MNVAAELVRQGNHASLLVHDGQRSGQYKIPKEVGVHKLAGPTSDWAFRRDIAEVRRYLKTETPLVYFPNGGHCGYAAAAQLKDKEGDLRVVGMVHSDESPYYKTLAYYEPVIDRFIGVSYAITDRLRQLLPEHRHSDIVCLPYGVPVPEPLPRKRGKKLKLLYAGRLAEAQKRVSRLKSLADELLTLGVDFEFHVAGDGAERQALEATMAGRAIFHGPVSPDAVRSLMKKCEIIVQLSDFEGTSLTMLEGMAAGMVPVMSAVSGIDAVIDDGQSGFLQPVGDVRLAAEQIARLDLDRDRLKNMGECARARIVRDFSIESNAATLGDLCASLLGEATRRRQLRKAAFPMREQSRIFYAKAVGKLRSEMRRFGLFSGY